MVAIVKPFFSALIRKKHYKTEDIENSKLKRCLGLFDITTLGIGSTVGLGMYVIGGQVASTKAGPAVVGSYLIAGITALFAALCYAEFGARVPRAGSAYVYSYVTIGELLAFFIGWDLILEYVIGAASIARGYSGYIDSLIGGHVERHLTFYLPMSIPHMSAYPDLLAFSIVFILTMLLAFGVKESSRFQAIFTILNLLIVVFILIVGGRQVDIHNWQLNATEVTSHGVQHGNGGFMPFGVAGLMSGAATCFYAFVGFDVIATMGEEVKNPKKNIPLSICISLIVVVFVYSSVATVQTLLWPYWDQDRAAPLPYIFEQLDMPAAKWIVAIGALAGLSSTLIGALFPLPRVMYAMAGDGLLFRFFAKIHPKYKTPMAATIISGLFAGTMAALFNVAELADMMSVGTLNAYSLVSLSVMILRYEHKEKESSEERDNQDNQAGTSRSRGGNESIVYNLGSPDTVTSPDGLRSRTISPPLATPNPIFQRCRTGTISKKDQKITLAMAIRGIFNVDNAKSTSKLTATVSRWVIGVCVALILALDVTLVSSLESIIDGSAKVICAVVVLVLLIVVCLIALARQPSAEVYLSFEVPWVPLVPMLSILANMYLAFSLSWLTWMRFLIWFLIGMVIYFSYGIFNSTEKLRHDLEIENKRAKDLLRLVPRINLVSATPENVVKVY